MLINKKNKTNLAKKNLLIVNLYKRNDKEKIISKVTQPSNLSATNDSQKILISKKKNCKFQKNKNKMKYLNIRRFFLQ